MLGSLMTNVKRTSDQCKDNQLGVGLSCDQCKDNQLGVGLSCDQCNVGSPWCWALL